MAAYIRNGFLASCMACYEGRCHEVLVKKKYVASTVISKAFLFVGDSNVQHREWLNSISRTDCHGQQALAFSAESG